MCEKKLGKFLSINEVLHALEELGLSGLEHSIDADNAPLIAEALECFTSGIICQIQTTINGDPDLSLDNAEVKNVERNEDMILFDGVYTEPNRPNKKIFSMSKLSQSRVQFMLASIIITSVSSDNNKLMWTISPSEVFE